MDPKNAFGKGQESWRVKERLVIRERRQPVSPQAQIIGTQRNYALCFGSGTDPSEIETGKQKSRNGEQRQRTENSEERNPLTPSLNESPNGITADSYGQRERQTAQNKTGDATAVNTQ